MFEFLYFFYMRSLLLLSLLLGLLGGLALDDVLDNLLLLNQEGAHDPLAHALVAPRATVGTADGLSALGEIRVRAGAKVGNLARPLESNRQNRP